MRTDESTIRDARRTAVRRMQRERREQRLAFETELDRRGVSGDRRDRLLDDFETEHRRQILAYERWFRANLKTRTVVP